MDGQQTVWIIRHGNRIDFVDPTWREKFGHDPHLSPNGVQQARATGRRLIGEGIRHVFASPFLRAVETAYHVADALDLDVKVEGGLSEWMKTEWFPQPPALLSVDELAAKFGRIDTTYRPIATAVHGESGEEATARAAETARTLADTHDGDILLVGHGHSVMGAAEGLIGRPVGLTCGLCALVKIARADGQCTLELDGDAAHLEGGTAAEDKFN